MFAAATAVVSYEYDACTMRTSAVLHEGRKLLLCGIIRHMVGFVSEEENKRCTSITDGGWRKKMCLCVCSTPGGVHPPRTGRCTAVPRINGKKHT